MTGLTRVAIVAAASVAAVVLFLALRPGDDDPGDVATRPRTTAPGTTATTERPRTRPPQPPRPATALVRIAVRNGRAIGGVRRVRLDRGRRLLLVVTADVADHVHVHGYDVMRDVAPGAPARIRLRATIPGRFEVELEDRGLLIADLEVRP